MLNTWQIKIQDRESVANTPVEKIPSPTANVNDDVHAEASSSTKYSSGKGKNKQDEVGESIAMGSSRIQTNGTYMFQSCFDNLYWLIL
jgi:hypothetical protein